MARATRSQSVPLFGMPENSKFLTKNQAFNEMTRNCDFLLHQKSQSKKAPIKAGLANRLDKIETDILRQEELTANLVKLRKNSSENFVKHEVHINERFAVFDQTVLGLNNRMVSAFEENTAVLRALQVNLTALSEFQGRLPNFVETSLEKYQIALCAKIEEQSNSIFGRIECLSDEIRAKHNHLCDEFVALKDQVSSERASILSAIHAFEQKVTDSVSENVDRSVDGSSIEESVTVRHSLDQTVDPLSVPTQSTFSDTFPTADNSILNFDPISHPQNSSGILKTGPPPYPGESVKDNNYTPAYNSQQVTFSGADRPPSKVGTPFGPTTSHSEDYGHVSQRELMDLLKLSIKGKSVASVPLKDMPKFDGSDSSKLIKFFEEFERCKAFCGWEDDISIQKLRNSCLVGFAKKVVSECPEVDEYETYSAFKKFLKRKFFAASDKHSAISQVMSLKQHPDQSLTDFHESLYELGDVALGNDASREAVLVASFISNLNNPWVGEAVERKCPTTMSQALAMAKDEERLQSKRKERMRYFFPQKSGQTKAQRQEQNSDSNFSAPKDQSQNPSSNRGVGGNRSGSGNRGGYANRFQTNPAPPANSPANSNPNRFQSYSGSSGGFPANPNSGTSGSPNAQASPAGGSTVPRDA